MPPQASEVSQAVQQAAFLGIRLEGWLTIAALILGPIIALALQRYSERRRAQQNRKLLIFKELMATRAATVSGRHVEALNAIEIEFSGKSHGDRAVTAAWRAYLDQLSDPTIESPDDTIRKRWSDRVNTLLIELLFAMSQALGFQFDKKSLEKGIYSPRAHSQLEDEQTKLRRFLIELMEGKRWLWSGIFTGERPVQVQFVPPPSPTAAPVEQQNTALQTTPVSSSQSGEPVA